ncbi:MAG: DUF975 family protein [Bacilli bacterium]|nr:DUF975 family protein [Bacilli bacterium]
MDNSKLKSLARKRLDGKYSVVVLSLLLFMVLGGCCSFIAIAVNASWTSSLLMFIVESLLMMGFVGIVLNISRGKKVSLDDLFTKTDLFGKYIVITLILALATFIITLLGYLAFKSLIMVSLYHTEINLFLAIFLILFGLFLTIAIIMVGIYLAIAFSQTYFILYDEPKLGILEILEKSFDMMADYILEYFILVISFIGWAILGIFTFGLLYLWLIPYMLVTFAVFYDKVKAAYEGTTGNLEAKPEPKKVVASSSKSKTTKTTTATKAPAKKTAAKTSTVAKAPAKKTTTKKTAATKPAAKKATTKTSTASKAPAKKTTTKKTTATKPAAKKATTKVSTAKKTTTKKTTTKSTTKTAAKKTTK